MSARPVIQYDLNKNIIKRFDSQKEAVKETGISDYRMAQARKKNKSVDGFYFEFETEIEPWHFESQCEWCGKTYINTKQRQQKNEHHFCSQKCQGAFLHNSME